MAGRSITPAEIQIRLSELPREQIFARASSLILEMGEVFRVEALDALFEAVPKASSDEERAARLGWVNELPSTAPAGCYLQAKLMASANKPAEAAARWTEFFSLYPCRDPFIWLQSARVHAQLKQYDQAATQLREALTHRPPYTFYARSAKLIKEVWSHRAPTQRRTRIAILGSTTTGMVMPVVGALCFRDGINAEFYEGTYGAFRQEILDPASRLYSFAPNIVFIFTNWRDLNLPPLSSSSGDGINDGNSEAAAVAEIAGEYGALWRTLGERTTCHIVQHAFDLPPQDAYGYLAESLAGGRTRIIRSLNLELVRTAPEFVSVLDTASVMSEVGIDRWEDTALWHVAKQHPSAEALPALAELQMAHTRAVTGLTRKVVVCDLDNTLWGGIIGEDGVGGIQIGPASPQGEAYAKLQQYLLELKSRGILLAVCSKNNPDDARLPFEQHEHMLLKLDDFAAFYANWNNKVENMRAIAKQLSLGTDSFVFIDDNPLERAWVRSQLPEVAVVELGATPFTYTRDLDRGRYFYSLTFSAEDRTRADLYRSEAARESMRGSADSLDEFLEGLHMRATAVPISAANVARVAQLINKTNQFNLTTRRYTQAQVEELAARKDAWSGVFQLADRFGDHGIIGIMLCVGVAESPERTWEIDTWLMSCRVLGRQMENFMLDRLTEAARAAGVRKLIGVYRPTAKNSQVADLYPRFDFRGCLTSMAEEQRYELTVPAESAAPYATFIENISAALVM